jgi:hypothetical protein
MPDPEPRKLDYQRIVADDDDRDAWYLFLAKLFGIILAFLIAAAVVGLGGLYLLHRHSGGNPLP